MREVKMAGYRPSSLFAFLWTEAKSRSIKRKKRTRPIPSYLDRTNLVNKIFIIWHKGWRVPLYPDWINGKNTIIWLVTFQIQISKSNFQIFKFKTSFCICRFLLHNVFLKLINIFVFSGFILVDAFSGSIRTEKSQKTFLP